MTWAARRGLGRGYSRGPSRGQPPQAPALAPAPRSSSTTSVTKPSTFTAQLNTKAQCERLQSSHTPVGPIALPRTGLGPPGRPLHPHGGVSGHGGGGGGGGGQEQAQPCAGGRYLPTHSSTRGHARVPPPPRTSSDQAVQKDPSGPRARGRLSQASPVTAGGAQRVRSTKQGHAAPLDSTACPCPRAAAGEKDPPPYSAGSGGDWLGLGLSSPSP